MLCKTKGCNNKANRGCYCYKCTQSIYRKNNPLKASFHDLKNNAKRRHKEFKITFEQFKEFALKSKYFYKKGRYKNSFHIDRIDELKGYTIDNIQILTNIQNLKKYFAFKYRDQNNKLHFEVTTRKKIKHSDCPF